MLAKLRTFGNQSYDRAQTNQSPYVAVLWKSFLCSLVGWARAVCRFCVREMPRFSHQQQREILISAKFNAGNFMRSTRAGRVNLEHLKIMGDA